MSRLNQVLNKIASHAAMRKTAGKLPTIGSIARWRDTILNTVAERIFPQLPDGTKIQYPMSRRTQQPNNTLKQYVLPANNKRSASRDAKKSSW